jgi:hypothetical protein
VSILVVSFSTLPHNLNVGFTTKLSSYKNILSAINPIRWKIKSQNHSLSRANSIVNAFLPKKLTYGLKFATPLFNYVNTDNKH